MEKSWNKPWFKQLINDYKLDNESVYHTWFIDPERIKYFGAIRRGVQKVVEDIKEGQFPNDLKGSSLEVVVEAISEQKQVFAGANHPWAWKPKLRIPDIYENLNNKARFGECLESCLNSTSEKTLLKSRRDNPHIFNMAQNMGVVPLCAQSGMALPKIPTSQEKVKLLTTKF